MKYEGTAVIKNKPLVTMLTEAMARDFAPSYHFTTDEQLWKDTQSWLLGLEHAMNNDSDRALGQVTSHMIRKNAGWVTILAGRVRKLVT